MLALRCVESGASFEERTWGGGRLELGSVYKERRRSAGGSESALVGVGSLLCVVVMAVEVIAVEGV